MGALAILVVEDNKGDVALIEQTFDERDLPATVHSVQTGEQALDWLYRRGEFADAPRPDLVLLDLNLPATSGHSLLVEIKSDSRLQRLPVIILTGSQSDDDVFECYEAGANACLIKPIDPNEFGDQLQSLVEFWGATVELPSSTNAP